MTLCGCAAASQKATCVLTAQYKVFMADGRGRDLLLLSVLQVGKGTFG